MSYLGILLREHVQGEAEPSQPAPRDGAVRETRKAWWMPLRFRLAFGAASGRPVADDHPTAAPHPAPGAGAARETRKAWWLPLRFRLACGTRSGRLVDDHHRTTERHTPQSPRISLAELRGFLANTLCV